jgi:hypothetical protein
MGDVDWVVVPSVWWENSPLVIQEAFQRGRPVICSDIGGMAEKVADGVDGLHFRAGDPEALAATIARAATDPGSGAGCTTASGRSTSMTGHLAWLEACTTRCASSGRRGAGACLTRPVDGHRPRARPAAARDVGRARAAPPRRPARSSRRGDLRTTPGRRRRDRLRRRRPGRGIPRPRRRPRSPTCTGFACGSSPSRLRRGARRPSTSGPRMRAAPRVLRLWGGVLPATAGWVDRLAAAGTPAAPVLLDEHGRRGPTRPPTSRACSSTPAGTADRPVRRAHDVAVHWLRGADEPTIVPERCATG